MAEIPGGGVGLGGVEWPLAWGCTRRVWVPHTAALGCRSRGPPSRACG